ncbi:MAG: hypothetical protein K2V38_06930, partial [Gemmataceae bacterium]|nr:hypothetical protein [Gemmataceae bacterium]
AIDIAVRVAEHAAYTATISVSAADTASAYAGADSNAADAAAHSATRSEGAARTAVAAADAAHDAVYGRDDVIAVARAVFHADHNAANAICRDFEIVSGFAKANDWTDDTPVPPSVFGPLWSEGVPEDWPKPEKPATELCIRFDVPDEMSTDEALALAKELSVALCELHLAGGGHGVAIQPPLDITIPAPVPAGAP